MEKQLEFVKTLFYRLHDDCHAYITAEDAYEKARKTKNAAYYDNGNYMNKNHGKTAIKRKITLLRQELLNLEKMLEE